MSSLNVETLREILRIGNCEIDNYKTFIETGTYLGSTVLGLSHIFDKLYTIELSNHYYEKFNQLTYNKEKINSLLGDSSKVLPQILSEIKDNVIFWLDGHYSSDDTAQGDKDCPLVEEIISINEVFNKSGVIIIDDLRLFGTKQSEDWSEISKESVVEPIKNRVVSTFEHGDRLVIVFN